MGEWVTDSVRTCRLCQEVQQAVFNILPLAPDLGVKIVGRLGDPTVILNGKRR